MLVLAGFVTAIKLASDKSAESSLATELRFAQAEGLPATPGEFAATLPQIKADENAGPVYQRMAGVQIPPTWGPLADDLIYTPNPKNLAEAAATLARDHNFLSLAEQAIRLPHCRIDRGWTHLEALTGLEEEKMKEAARLLEMRGSLAADRGDVAGALAGLGGVRQIAAHLSEEPTYDADRQRQSVYADLCRTLVGWAFVHRDVAAYRQALEAAVSAYPDVDPKRDQRAELMTLLQCIEALQRPKAWRDFGLPDDKLSLAERYVPSMVDVTASRTTLVAAERRYWRSFGLPVGDRAREQRGVNAAVADVFSGFYSPMRSFSAWLMPTSDGWETRFRLPRLCFMAAARALAGPKIPASIDTSDLKDPASGQRVSYTFARGRITIAVNSHVVLAIPPSW